MSPLAELRGTPGKMAGASAETELRLDFQGAFGLWRASTQPATWTTASGWPNEGTGGSAYDLTAANEAPGLGTEDGNEQAVTDANRVTPTLVSGPAGFAIGFATGNATDARDDYGFAGANGLDMSGSWAFTIDYTPTDVTDDDAKSCRPLRKGGPFGHQGVIIEQVPIAFGGAILIGIGSTADPGNPAAGYVAATSTPEAGRQQATIVVDRTAHVGRFYRKATQISASLSDETGIGDSTTAFPMILGAGNTIHNVLFHKGLEAEQLDAIALHLTLRRYT